MVDCAICLQHLKLPVKVLRCGHSFCLRCLKRLRNQLVADRGANIRRLICPTCRFQTPLEGGSVRKLPNNYALHEAIEQHKLYLRQIDNKNNSNVSLSITSQDCDTTNNLHSDVTNALEENDESDTMVFPNLSTSSAFFEQTTDQIVDLRTMHDVYNEDDNAYNANGWVDAVPPDFGTAEEELAEDYDYHVSIEDLDTFAQEELMEDNNSNNYYSNWYCPNSDCYYNNFSFRASCRCCGTARPDT